MIVRTHVAVIGSFAGTDTANNAVEGLMEAGFVDSTTVTKATGDVSEMLMELQLHREAAEHFGREVDAARTLVIVIAEDLQHVVHQHHLMDYAIGEMQAAGTLPA